MKRRAVVAAIECAFLFLAPLAWSPALLLHPAPWLGLATALTVLLSQPPVDLRESASRTGRDRGSALGIFVAMIATQAVATIEFAARARGEIGPAVALGGALAVAGLILRLSAIRTLGRFFTSTVRVAGDQSVVQVGPYRWIRHPSYLGALVCALGVVVALESRIGVGLVIVLCVPAYLYRVRAEEHALVAALGTAYSNYRRRTWGLIPGVR